MADTVSTPKIPAPPAPVISGNVYRVNVIGKLENCVTVSTFAYQDTNSPGSATETETNELLALFLSAEGPMNRYILATTNDFIIDRLTCDSPTSPQVLPAVHVSGVSGNGPAGHLPNQTCVTLIKRTSLRGKRGRGRLSMPAVAVTDCLGTVLINDMVYKNLATSMKAVLNGIDTSYVPGIYAFTWEAAPVVQRHTFAVLKDVTVNSTLGTCRRRKPGVGK